MVVKITFLVVIVTVLCELHVALFEFAPVS